MISYREASFSINICFDICRPEREVMRTRRRRVWTRGQDAGMFVVQMTPSRNKVTVKHSKQMHYGQVQFHAYFRGVLGPSQTSSHLRENHPMTSASYH